MNEKIIKKALGAYENFETNINLAEKFILDTLKLISLDLFEEEYELEEFNKKILDLDLHKKGVVSNYLSKMIMMIKVGDKKLLEQFFMVVQWYYEDCKGLKVPKEILEKENNIKGEIKILKYEELKALGWRPAEIVNASTKISYETMPELMDEEELQTDDDIMESTLVNAKDRISTIVYKGKIIGFWSFVPLSKSEFDKTKKGKLDESKMKTVKMNKPGKYKIYVVSIGILHEYRNAKTLAKLMDSFFHNLIDMAKKKIFITEIVADAFTNEGEIMCKMIDMKFVCNHYVSGKIYYKKFHPIDKDDSWNKKYPEIIELYSNI